MARRTKAQLVEFEVETALEKALDVDFDTDVLINDALDAESDTIDLDDLAKQIAQATAETSTPSGKAASSTVDASVAEQLFKKPSASTSTPAGTVKNPVVAEPLQAANDDRNRLRAGKNKVAKNSFKRIYMCTTALSALWAAGGLVFASKLSSGGLSSLGSFLSSPTGLAVAAGTVLPIAMFWGFAQLAKRAKELQAVVQSISEAATRLVEPDKESEAKIVKLGQAVRHEIAMMGEGLERTISRAAELEALVQGEVQNLERAYSENESRIHNLIKELNTEREAILGHADRVKYTIRSSQDQLSGEFNAITSNIANNVQKITSTISDTVRGNGEDLIRRIHSAGDEVAQRMSDRVDNHSTELSAKLDRSAEQALKNFEQKFGDLDGKIESRAKQSVLVFDERVGSLVSRADSIASAFDTATEQAIHAFEGRLSKMDSMLGERSNSIIHSFIARAQSLDSNTEKLGEVLEERVTFINSTLKERTEEIARTFETGYSQVNSALKQRVNDIAAAFSGGNNEINGTLRKHIEEISKTVGNNYQQLNSVLQQRLLEITTAFEGGNSQLADALNQHADHVSKTFGQGYEKISGSLQDCSNEIIKAFEGKNDLVTESLRARVVEIEQVFENGFRYIDDTMNDRIKDITQSIAGTQGVLDDTLKARLVEVVDTFNQNRDEISNTMRERVFEIARAFDGGHNDIKTTLQDYASEVSRALEGERFNINTLVEDVASRLSGEVDRIDEAVGRALNERVDSFTLRFAEGRALLEQAMQNGGDEIMQSVKGQLQSLSGHVEDIEKTLLKNIQLVDQYTVEHSETLGARTLELTSTIENSVSAAREVLDTQARNIDIRADSLRDSLTLNSSALNEVLADQAHILEGRIESIRELLSRSDLKFSEVINSQVQAVETAVGKNSDVLKLTFNEHLQSLSAHTDLLKTALADSTLLHTSLDETTDKIQNTFTAQGAALEEQTNVIQQVLQSGMENLRASMENGAAIVSEGLTERVAQAVEIFTNKMQGAGTTADEIGSKLRQTITSFETGVEQTRYTLAHETDRIAETFQDKINTVTAGISDRIWDSSERVVAIGTEATRMVEEAASVIENRLADRSAFLSMAAQQVELNVDDRLNAIGERLSEITSGHIGNFTNQIDQINRASQTLMSAATQTGQSFDILSEEFAQKLNVASSGVRDELRKGNDELAEAFSKRVAETIAAIHSAENDVNQNIGTILGNVNTLLDQLNQSVNNIQHCSGDLLSGIEEIDGKFSATARSFNANVDAVRENLTQSSDVLAANVEQLRNLSGHAIGQMEEMGRHFAEHSGLLEQAANLLDNSQHSFTATIENRQKALHVLSSGLAAKSDEVANIIKRYSDMLMATMQDTQRQSKQSAIDMQRELAVLVEQASEKFETATAEIRKNADEVRAEISMVSTDINNTVQTLPTQTRQSTDAMRRAITDQIAALKELTGLMNHSSGMVDVSRAVNTSRPIEFPEEAFVAQKTEKEPEKSPLTPSFTDASTHTRKEKKHSGWVSELLARASRDDRESDDAAPAAVEVASTVQELDVKTQENEVPTMQDVHVAEDAQVIEEAVESLNSMSKDILRAVNSDAIVELWSHFRRGQRNIVPQQLYTQEGLKTFEEIQEKYNQDKDFRQSVNQYITDFERLLREIQETEGKGAVRDYLISDTGKVYTMLAHVSSRIQ